MMSSTNRLLDMLKSTTSGSPSHDQSTSSFTFSAPVPPANDSAQSAKSAQPVQDPSQHLAPPQSNGSPREPSPDPPPPSLQAVSLSDLFASLTSPAPQTSGGSPKSPPEGSQNQKSKLLGMLNSIGSVPSSGSPTNDRSASAGSHEGSRSDPRSRKVSRAREDMPSPSVNHGTPSKTLVTPSRAPLSLSEPVISHPTGRPTPPNGSNTNLPELSGISTVPAPPAITSPAIPNMTSASAAPGGSPAASTSQPPQKSIFDFVSPFSVFDAKSTPSKPPAQEKKQPPASSPAPRGPSASRSPLARDLSPLPNVAKESPKIDAPHLKPSRTSPTPGSNTDASASASQFSGLPFLVKKVVEGAQGSGPRALGREPINFDLSKRNLDSLYNPPEAVKLIPTTIIKSEDKVFIPGRTVAMTPDWISYAMSKARVRLIAQATGNRLMIQVPSRPNAGPIIDLAALPTSIAIVTPDRSVAVYQVPQTWNEDDPPHQPVFLASSPTDSGHITDLGEVNRVEWIRRPNGEHWLAIGGANGVIVVNPDELRHRDNLTLAELATQNRVLVTEGGPVVSFCINSSHQVLGVLSKSSQVTLYNLSGLQRVWNRQIPKSPAPGPPTSIQFCENNILIGRANNTIFDVVQITTDIAVLQSISFNAPPPSPTQRHFCQAMYDPHRTILWICASARGSIFGFKYGLKGVTPAKASEMPPVFSNMAEIPFEPVLSIVQSQQITEDYAEFLFATTSGIDLAQISRTTCDALLAGPSIEPAQSASATPQTQKQKNAGQTDTHVAVVNETPSKAASTQVAASFIDEKRVDGHRELPKTHMVNGQGGEQDAPESAEAARSSDELAKALRRTESTLQNNFKQTLSNQITPLMTRLDLFSGGALAAEIGGKIEKQIKSSVTSTVQAEIKRSVLPALSSSIEAEVRTATSSIPAVVHSALQTLPRELETTLAPLIQRTIATVVQSAVDRAVQDALITRLLPAMEATSVRLGDQLHSEFKSEMVQIRKDFSPTRQDSRGSDETIRSLASSITDLQRQMAILSDHILRAPPMANSIPPVPPMAVAPPPVPQHPPPPVQAVPQPLTPRDASQLEDIFLAALGSGSTAATMQLLNDYWPRTEVMLPNPPGRTVFSQAVLLTLFHRVAVALSEVVPYDPNFGRLATWERKITYHLDPRNPDIAGYIPRVFPVVENSLNPTLDKIHAPPFASDPSFAEQARSLRQVLDFVRSGGGR